MSRTPKLKSLSSFDPIYEEIWARLLLDDLPKSNDDDPCAMPDCAFLTFPSRREAERMRYSLSHFRTTLRRHAQHSFYPPEQRRLYAERASRLERFRVRVRNAAAPEHSTLANFHTLPDGLHYIYLWPTEREHPALRAQIGHAGTHAKARPKPEFTDTTDRIGASDQDQALRSIGYGTNTDEAPISEDDFFAEEEPN